MPTKLKRALAVTGLVLLVLVIAYTADRASGHTTTTQQENPSKPQEAVVENTLETSKPLEGEAGESGESLQEFGESSTLVSSASTVLEDSSSYRQVLLEGHSSGLEAVAVDKRVYDNLPEMITDITGYAAFDVEFTNNSSETVSVNRSVNSCSVNGRQHTYERDLDPATAPRPVLAEIAPGEKVTMTLACDTHDTSAELEYVLQIASSTTN